MKKCLLLMCLLLTLPLGAQAAEGEYCFTARDFGEGEIQGVFLTQTPERGALLLGSRELRPGDVLTAGQLDGLRYTGTDEGEEALGYRLVADNRVGEESRMVISVQGKRNAPPVAEDSLAETYKNLPITEKLRVTDPEGTAMTFQITRQPRRGSVTVAPDGSFTYTPKKNKIGVDSFVYTAMDGDGKTSREATVTIHILKPTEDARYTDTLGKECRFAAEWMKNTGIFVAESVDGQCCFSPEKQVSRGDFIAMAVKALGLPVEQGITETGYGEEVPQWLRPYLAAAVRAGIWKEASPELQPEEPITQGEAAALLGLPEDGEGFLTRGDAACMLYRSCKPQ